MAQIKEQKHSLSGNEAWRIRWTTRLVKFIILFSSGMLMSSSLPPLNWSATAWIAIIPLFWICSEQNYKRAALSGFIWGFGWAFTCFFWLREIETIIPFFAAMIMAPFPAVWACLVPCLHRGILIPNDVQLQGYTATKNFMPASVLKTFFYAVIIAAWWCVTEWFRSRFFPWNYVSTSQWQNLSLIQICSVTGTYGISFLIVLTNITLAIAFKNRFRGTKGKVKFPQAYPFYITLFLLLAVSSIGAYKYHSQKAPQASIEFNAGLIQGDISQRRQASVEQALEALNVYLKMSYEIVRQKPAPDIIIWPESATPFAYKGNNWLSKKYRIDVNDLIKYVKLPLVLGTIDFEDLPPQSKREPGMLNSAILFGPDGKIKSKYSKIQRVPFGEYVPFRKYLPEWIVKRIDMHRDLISGKSFAPLEILPGVRAGVSVCYEDMFEYISRQEVLNNANLLLVITNDAWYPTSSEPDQHLANCVFRTIETGLPMLRVGNNSASCLIQPNAYISDCLFEKKSPKTGKMTAAPEVRGRRAGVIKVRVPLKTKLTFYSRYGNVFLALCWLLVLAGIIISILNWRQRKLTLMGKFKGEASDV
ncbi:MAG: apolipoprotein N-acyltransferase [Victivallales bacterium]|nr:apolipoprotein N-acyltransferase [Victivallales bacterium]